MNLLLKITLILIATVLLSCRQESQTESVPELGRKVIFSWDSEGNPRLEWSKKLILLIDEEWPKLSKASDFSRFCPNYDKLEVEIKKRVMGEIIVGMAFFESSWKPTTWMTETTMGTDCITGKQIRSEGLMQMSYCDTTWAKECKFDWSKDKFLDENDPKKTIFDPETNLHCAIKVLSSQVNKNGKLVLPRGKQYWAVILDGGKYEKTDSIALMVQKSIKECKDDTH